MAQPPGSLEDLQPQDLSTSRVPAVIDLTRKGTSLEALQAIESPGWYTNSETSSPGLPSSETGSLDVTLQPGDQIQPDNAFSHTTVTLSYVSRSHICAAHDSLSGHSPLYGVPPLNKFSLHSPCEAEKGLGETGYALNQHYLEHGDRPMDLASQTELFHAMAQAPPDSDGIYLVQQPCEFNGGVMPSNVDIDDKPLRDVEDCGLSRETETSGELTNGQVDNWSSSGACAESSPDSVPKKDEKTGVSEALYLISNKQDSAVTPDHLARRHAFSLNREFISPLEDPVSPSATSLDDVEDVFILPQASSSPSGDNSLLETADEVAWDDSSTEGTIQPRSGISDAAARLDLSAENRKPVSRRKAELGPLIDLTDDACLSEVTEEKPHMNGNVRPLERTLQVKRLPMRSGRGTRLEAIVMNINSTRYKVSGCIRASKNAKASRKKKDSNLAVPKTIDRKKKERKVRGKATYTGQKSKKQEVSQLNQGKTNSINTDSCKDSTSDSEIINNSKKPRSSKPPKSSQATARRRSKKKRQGCDVSSPSLQSPGAKSQRKPSSTPGPRFSACMDSEKDPESVSPLDPSSETQPLRRKASPKKSSGTAKGKAAGQKRSSPTKAKAARAPKRRRKKHKQSQSSSMFSPKEPEIKLKYVHYKEEKRDLRVDSFSPFVRVQRQKLALSLCTVINYPEEARTRHKKGQQQPAHPGGFVSAVIPSTSCLQLGRAYNHSQHQRALVCSLCGLSANAMDLGDLHGPYYPEGYLPCPKTPACASDLKADKDGYSDSDSSSCSVRARGRKGTIPSALRPFRPPGQLKKILPQSQQRTGSDASSPAAKRARSDDWSPDVEDWYSPPVLPQEPCEYWLHEDCGIWSAGVFLVKGKVYGLEEAVKLAQETVCSACSAPGATLGCFFKGCPNKFHYRCALESDCILIEENFSMKCKKHKNKTFKAPSGKQRDAR